MIFYNSENSIRYKAILSSIALSQQWCEVKQGYHTVLDLRIILILQYYDSENIIVLISKKCPKMRFASFFSCTRILYPNTVVSKSERLDALVRRFNFSRASHKSKLSAVLFIELLTIAVLSLHQITVIVQVQ